MPTSKPIHKAPNDATTPISPGPLVMNEHELTTWDGWVLASFHNRPDWEGYAAWLVRASNSYVAPTGESPS